MLTETRKFALIYQNATSVTENVAKTMRVVVKFDANSIELKRAERHRERRH